MINSGKQIISADQPEKKMSTSGSTSSDLAKGKKFLKKLLYVQHVDKEKETASEISDRYLEEFLLLADRTDFRDSNFTEYLIGKSPKANLSILKSSMRVAINQVTVYSNPLPIPLQLKDVTIHAFVVFDTENYSNGISKMWWSLEKNGKHIVLQQSTNEDDVIKKIYDTEKKTSVERLGPIQKQKSARNWRSDGVWDLMRIIVDTNKLNERYHLLFSNCQNFASFVFEKLSHRREKWSTMTSAIVDGIGLKNKKIEPENKVDAFKYKSIVNDDKFDCYWAMMEGTTQDFEKLTNHLTIESLNRVDSQGYTLIEWATVFSSSHWPIDEQLKKKGAKIPSDEGSFRRNVFFIALQYLPPAHQKLLSFDGIDISGVNGAGDTSLHLSLYGDKREIAETILNQFEDYDVNSTNSLGDTPLLLTARLGWDFNLFNVFIRILERTNQENINKADRNGWTALHYAIDQESETQVEELLKRDDVDVNIQNNADNRTALHLASNWPNIPMDLFQIILEKTDNINAQDVNGNTALHFAIGKQCDNKVNELLKHENNVNVNVKNNTNDTPLHLASKWTNISADLFKIILEKSTDINAQDDEDGRTALHNAILCECDIATKALLAHNDVDFNVKNYTNETPLHLASKREEISSDLFKLILEKSRDINAQDNQGNTALHYAILGESEIATEELLKHSDVNVNIKNYYDNITALHFACCWKDIPVDLFNLILENSTDINTPDEDGRSALHWAIFHESEMATKELLAHNDVNVNFKNRNSGTALYSACLYWKDIPVDLFKIILEKTADVNAQCDDGRTALHWAIICKSDIATKELLAHKHVNVNVKDNKNKTALSYVSMWKAIPSDLFKLISERSTNEVKKFSKMDRLSK